MRKLSKNEWLATALALVFVAYMFFGGNIMSLFNSFKGEDQSAMASKNIVTGPNGSGVQVEDLVVGSGTTVETGMEVSVNYVLKLGDGTVIQDSKQMGGAAFTFIAGAGQLIPGWEMGILGMKVGSKRMIVIPPELGYGSQQVGPIPPDSTLIFEIEVISAGFPNQN